MERRPGSLSVLIPGGTVRPQLAKLLRLKANELTALLIALLSLNDPK